jgi:glycosyltransferase involved in cell wall biosynthesis
VAYFSDVLAKKYHKEGVLKGVISLSPHQPEARNFPLVHVPLIGRNYGSMPGDDWIFFRKLNSLFSKTWNTLIGKPGKPVIKALESLNFNAKTDVLFFTYQVHQPSLFEILHQKYKGEQWMLYHGLDLIGFQKFPSSIDYVLNHASKMLFNSEATMLLFLELGFKTAVPKEVIHPFLDEDYINSLELYSTEQLESITNVPLKETILFTSICRLVKRKGIHFAIDIVANLTEKTDGNIQYLIAGTGPELESLKNKVRDMGLLERIHFLGYVDDRLKYSLLKQSKVFLMPNYDDGGGDFEGFGISFLEAGYFGNHIIAGSHGGAIEAMQYLKSFELMHIHNPKDFKVVEKNLTKLLSVYAN